MSAVIDNSIIFDVKNKVFLINDLSSGISLPDSNGNMKIVSPDGVTYYNNQDFTVVSNTAAASTATTVTLDAADQEADNFYDRAWIGIVGGTGQGQIKKVISYVNSTNKVTVDSAFETALDGSSGYQIVFADIWIEQDNPAVSDTSNGTGTATTIILAAGSSAVDGTETNKYIQITNGTGAGQIRKIIAYDGGTVTATVNFDWLVIPDNTSAYTISLPATIDIALDSAGNIQSGLWTFTETVYDADADAYSTKVKTYTYNFTEPTITFDITIDCIAPLFKSVDATVYISNTITPSIVRKHSLYYPQQLSLSPVTGNVETLETSSLYTTLNTVSITSELIYDVTGGFFIWDTITDSEVKNVECDFRLCDFECCMRTLWNNWLGQRGVNSVEADKIMNQMIQANMIRERILAAYQCGLSDEVEGYITVLLLIANCKKGCGCADSAEPQPVIGLGGSSAITVVTGSYPIISTPNTSGNTTTYNVFLHPSIVTKITNLYSTIVQGVVNIVVGVSGSNPKTYTVTGATFSSTDSSVTITTTVNGEGIITNYNLKANAINVLENDWVSETNGATTGSYVSVKSYDIVANTLITNGSELYTKHALTKTAGSNYYGVKLLLQANTIFDLPIVVSDLFNVMNYLTFIVETKIVRISNTTVDMWVKIRVSSTANLESAQTIEFNKLNLTVLSLTGSTNVLDMQIESTVANGITYDYQQINIFKKAA